MSNKFQQVNDFSMGRLTSLLVLLHNTELVEGIEKEINERGYSYTVGKVGAMELSKVVAAIETSAKTNKIINAQSYREVHALYHAILEAIQGVSRGTLQLGDILRTVGLTFSIVRGKIEFSGKSDEWISVCVYGTIGAPKKGFEHDTLGFGFNHI
ncbi:MULTISPECIES: hut operon transcriptional regulator HutP [Priestia]|uniref:Hut operon positive regulatory protein n=1 Tax=Priestia megaterium TaxID=1404 RepID=A0A3D8X581_PRIMG|nr:MULTISPECIES: hut operon transcriptional regulator HutP [Priestia]MBU8689687.1 hut operon transcriptional regulator HutP [Priestia megaterium]MDH3174427.1 hut operon transcriptional regulator HutP [Priestia megaterium]MDY0940474.1 hut operon transcriptional regulator HutP [Priestia megaterium]RDZ16308.1 transcriptional regulator [Priestia megaterium]